MPPERSIIVTGAARGIGEEIARTAAAEGYRVGVLDVDGEGARRVAESLPDAMALPAPVNDEAAVVAAFDAFGAQLDAGPGGGGPAGDVQAPDVVVHNAGIVRFGSLAELSVQDWRDTLEVNLTGAFIVGRTAAARMVRSGGGSIVNLTSINGVTPGPYAGAYGSSKAAIALLSAQMAIEFGPDGVRVNSVAPGFVDGGMSTPLYADPATREARSSAVPLRRLGSPEEIARVVLWLGSSDASYVTGQNLVVDGGVSGALLANLPRPASVDGVGDSS